MTLLAATAHAARLPELAAAGSKTRVGVSTRISPCFIRLEVRQAPKMHRGNLAAYDGTAVGRLNAFNQLTSSGGPGTTFPPTTNAWDLNGNLLTETKSPSGLPVEVTTYGWDKDNRLRSVTPPSGTPTSYRYEANGVRAERIDESGTTRYVIDGNSVLAELDSTNAASTRFLNQPQKIDETLAYQQGSVTEYPLTDALGSVYGISSANGAIARRFDFGVFGTRVDLGGTSAPIDLGFAGRRQDRDGLSDNWNRQLNTRLGGWMQPDRLGMLAGSNAYSYVHANPAMYVDPTGYLAGSLFGPPTNSFDALLYVHPVAWLAIAVEIGILGAGVAPDLSRYFMSPDVTQIVGPCKDLQTQDQQRVLYRGLSTVDLGEWNMWGVVNSKFIRNGNPESDAVSLLALQDAQRRATFKSARWAMTDTSFNSSWVSVTRSEAWAAVFATTRWPGEDPPSGKVLRMRTRRYTVPSAVGDATSIKQEEELLFLRLGIPVADYIEDVYDAPR